MLHKLRRYFSRKPRPETTSVTVPRVGVVLHKGDSFKNDVGTLITVADITTDEHLFGQDEISITLQYPDGKKFHYDPTELMFAFFHNPAKLPRVRRARGR